MTSDLPLNSPSLHSLIPIAIHELVLTQLLKITVILPEILILTFSLVACHLVQNASIVRTILSLKVVAYGLDKFQLVIVKSSIVRDSAKVVKVLITTACHRQQRSSIAITVTVRVKLPNTECLDLILFRVRYQGSFMLFKKHFSYELSNPLHIEQLCYVYLIGKLFFGFLMPFVVLQSALVRRTILAATVATEFHQAE